MTVVTTIGRELEEELLSAVPTGQGIALDALRPLVETVHCVIPAMPVVRVPVAMAGGYGLAGQLLANQRQFAAR
jgi:hypothetical protein